MFRRISTNALKITVKLMSGRLIVLYFFTPWVMISQSSLDDVEQYIELKNYSAAEKILKRQLEIGPRPDLKDKLGEVYAYQLKWDKAIDIYEELTESVPDNASYLFRYGGVMAKKAQSSSSFTALMYISRIKSSFRNSLKLDPGSIATHWALVDLYVTLPRIVGGSYSKALGYAKQLQELSPLDGYLAIGYIQEYNDEREKARSNYMKAFNLLDSYSETSRNQLNYQIGKICSDYKIELDRGIKHLNLYIENYTVMDGVPLEWAYYRLAKIYRAKMDRKKTEFYIDQALAVKPDFGPALEERDKVASLQGF